MLHPNTNIGRSIINLGMERASEVDRIALADRLFLLAARLHKFVVGATTHKMPIFTLSKKLAKLWFDGQKSSLQQAWTFTRPADRQIRCGHERVLRPRGQMLGGRSRGMSVVPSR
jgi:hypothetical protein